MMPRLDNIATPMGDRTAKDLHRLRDVAHRVAGSVFYETMLKTMQESKLKGTFGHGGRGEEVFAGQLHGVLAERMGVATKHGLGDILYRRLAGQQERMSAGHSEGTAIL